MAVGYISAPVTTEGIKSQIRSKSTRVMCSQTLNASFLKVFVGVY